MNDLERTNYTEPTIGAGTLNPIDDGDETAGVTPLRNDEDMSGNNIGAQNTTIIRRLPPDHITRCTGPSQKKRKKTMAVRQLLVYRKSTATLIEESVSLHHLTATWSPTS